MSLSVIKTAGRNEATVINAMYTSLAGMGISYPQMVCVIGTLFLTVACDAMQACEAFVTRNTYYVKWKRYLRIAFGEEQGAVMRNAY